MEGKRTMELSFFIALVFFLAVRLPGLFIWLHIHD